jgi:hypothetical protein
LSLLLLPLQGWCSLQARLTDWLSWTTLKIFVQLFKKQVLRICCVRSADWLHCAISSVPYSGCPCCCSGWPWARAGWGYVRSEACCWTGLGSALTPCPFLTCSHLAQQPSLHGGSRDFPSPSSLMELSVEIAHSSFTGDSELQYLVHLDKFWLV